MHGEVGDVAVAGDRDVEVADALLAAAGEHARAGLDGDADVEVGAPLLAEAARPAGGEVADGPAGARVAAEDRGDVDLGVLAGLIETLGPEGDVHGGAGAQVAVVLVGAEQGGEVGDDPGLGEAAAALELAGLGRRSW